MAYQQARPTTIYDPRYRAIIETLKNSRKTAKITQTDMAQKLGLSQPDISKIERCERRIDALELLDWLAACNTPLSILKSI